nr:hypothetical protein [Streptomyces sp. 846.5]
MGALGKAELEAMIGEATVDAYGEDEQLTGLFTMMEESSRCRSARRFSEWR